MSAPLLWILIPGVAAIILALFRRRETFVTVFATTLAILLAALAVWLPDSGLITIRSWTAPFSDSISFFGRRFLLTAADRPTLVVLYAAVALWYGAVPVARPGRGFVPLSLGVLALLIAAIAVEPFLYAALLIELAVLLSIPFLVAGRDVAGRGILRYLTFQTLGMPFILIAGWLLTGVEVTQGDRILILQAAVMIGLGFAFLLSVFPLHTWIPMIAEEAHPYAAAFIFLLLPPAGLQLGLSFLERFGWLREMAGTYAFLRGIGALMVFTGGLWAAFQKNLGRLMGFSLILEIGFSFLALSLTNGDQASLFMGIFIASLIPRGLSLGLIALALSILRGKKGDLSYEALIGIGRQYPITVFTLAIALFNLAGLPLLGSFPPRWAIYQSLPALSRGELVWALAGSLGLLIGSVRALIVLLSGSESPGWLRSENRFQVFYLMAGAIGLLIMGSQPQWFMSFFINLPETLQRLRP